MSSKIDSVHFVEKLIKLKKAELSPDSRDILGRLVNIKVLGNQPDQQDHIYLSGRLRFSLQRDKIKALLELIGLAEKLGYDWRQIRP